MIEFKRLDSESFHREFTDAIVITDENVAATYPAFKTDIVIPPGEIQKSFRGFESLISRIAEIKATRKSQLVAFGGGVIGDLVGFAAATYMRGIPFTQVPTTLLAQVDSSVGGKVGIDLDQGKNLLGAFYPPSRVIIDPIFLNTLPEDEFRCGMAEVLKYGLIMDTQLWQKLIQLPLSPAQLSEQGIIERCVEHKKRVVEEDEFETSGLRATLNFGHTIGHAIEKCLGYGTLTHGDAIAIGMVQETKIAVQLGFAKPALVPQLIQGFQTYDLPTEIPSSIRTSELVNSMKIDKKSFRGEITMSLIPDIGQCKVVSSIDEKVIEEVLKSR